METELIRPINDTMESSSPLIFDDNNQQNPDEFMYYHQPAPPPTYHQPPIHYENYQDKKDLFTNLDKTAYVVIFVAFILGFFMGKTMQPVILRQS